MYQIYSGYFSVKIAYLAYLRLYLKKDAKITAAIPRVNFCHIVRKFKKTPTAAELTQELKLIFFLQRIVAMEMNFRTRATTCPVTSWWPRPPSSVTSRPSERDVVSHATTSPPHFRISYITTAYNG